MNSLISSLGNSSLGGGVGKLRGEVEIYISEVSSPTRLWIQEAKTVYDTKLKDMRNFYEKLRSDEFAIQAHHVRRGMKVAVFCHGEWGRAEVTSELNVMVSGKIRVFFIDFGTCGIISLLKCKMLMEDFATVPRQALRAGLYGIKPVGNARLWDINITTDFINFIRDKKFQIKIMKHHEHVKKLLLTKVAQVFNFLSQQEDFYEFLLFNHDGSIVNEKLIQNRKAEFVAADGPPPPCLFYPAFSMLENFVMYPSYSERYCMLSYSGMNFNKFEENHLPLVTNSNDFEAEMIKILNDKKFAEVRKVFMRLKFPDKLI